MTLRSGSTLSAAKRRCGVTRSVTRSLQRRARVRRHGERMTRRNRLRVQLDGRAPGCGFTLLWSTSFVIVLGGWTRCVTGMDEGTLLCAV